MKRPAAAAASDLEAPALALKDIAKDRNVATIKERRRWRRLAAAAAAAADRAVAAVSDSAVAGLSLDEEGLGHCRAVRRRSSPQRRPPAAAAFVAAAADASTSVAGPSSKKELFGGFPSALIVALFADAVAGPRRRTNLGKLRHRGLCCSSDYSGYDTPREVLRLVDLALWLKGGFGLPFKWANACDCDPIPQKVLVNLSLQVDDGRSCVFRNVLEKMAVDQVNILSKSDPVTPESKADVMGCIAAAGAYSKQAEYMLRNLGTCFPADQKAYCLVHSGMCRVQMTADDATRLVHGDEADDAPKPLIVNFAGHTCLGWTPAGKQLRSAHPAEKIFNVYLAERIASSHVHGVEDLDITECSHKFPAAEKFKPLQPTHECFSILCGPEDIGHPVIRPRLFAASLHRRDYAWTGPPPHQVQADFMNIFKRCCVMNGTAYFCAPASEVEAEQQHQVAVRRKFLSREHGLTGEQLRKILFPPGLQRRLAQYDSLLRAEGNTTAVLADVNNWPASSGGRGSLSERWPPMLCSSQVYNFEESRMAVAGEHMLAQGILWYEEVAGAYGVTPLKNAMASLTAGNVKSLVGNAIHCAAFMAWVLYVLSYTTPREVMAVTRLPPSSDNNEDDI